MSDLKKYILLPKAPDAKLVYSQWDDKILQTIDIANELNKLRTELEKVKKERDRLSKSLTSRIVDWLYCGMAHNDRHKDEEAMAEYYEVMSALAQTKDKD